MTGLRPMVAKPSGPEGAPAVGNGTPPPEMVARHIVGYRRHTEVGSPDTLQAPHGETVARRKEKELSEALEDRFLKRTVGYLEKLADSRRTRTAEEFNSFVRDSGHSYLLRLYNQFVENDRKQGSDYRSVNEEKLKEFIRTDAGYETIVRMEKALLTEQAILRGVSLELTPDNPETAAIQNESYSIQGEGVFRRWGRGASEWLGRPRGRPGGRGENKATREDTRHSVRSFLVDTRGRVLLTLTGASAGGAAAAVDLGNAAGRPGVALAGGLLTGVAPWVAAGLTYLSRRGETKEIEQLPVAAEISGQLIPQEAEFAREFWGEDPDQLEPSGVGVRVVRGRVSETANNERDIKAHLVGIAKDIRQHEQDKGTRNEFIAISDADWILRGALNAPQSNADFMRKVLAEFQPNHGGIQDMAGNSQQEEFPPGSGMWRANANFDSDNLNIPENFERWREAYETVLSNEISTVIHDIVEGKADHGARLFTDIKDKQTARKDQVEKRKALLGRQEEAFGKDRDALDPELRKLTDYQAKVAEARATIRAAEQKRQAEADTVTIAGWTAPVGAPVGTRPTLAEVQTALNTVLSGTGATVTLENHHPISSIEDQYTTLETQIGTAIGDQRTRTIDPIVTRIGAAEANLATELGATPRNKDAIRAAEAAVVSLRAQLTAAEDAAIRFEESVLNRPQFQSAAARIEANRELISGQIARIQNEGSAMQAAQLKLIDGALEGRGEAIGTLDALQRARETITAWGAATVPPIDLGTAALATESFNELLQRIHAANTQNNRLGWPATGDLVQEQRTQLLFAIADARGEQALAGYTASPRFADAVNPNAFAMTVMDLDTLPSAEIRRRMQERFASGLMTIVAPVPSIAQIDAIKRDAAENYRLRTQALQGVMTDAQQARQRANGELAAIKEDGGEIPELVAVDRVAKRYSVIRDAILNAADPTQRLNELLALGQTTDPNTRYNDYERGGGGRLQAEVNIRRLVFGHTDDTTARYGGEEGPEAAFRRNEALMSNDALYTIIVHGLNLGIETAGGIARPPDLTIAIQWLRQGLGIDAAPPLPVGAHFLRENITPVEVARVLSDGVLDQLSDEVQRF